MFTKPDELITIDLADLDDVSGGAATDQQIQDVLSGIQSSIKGLAQPQGGGITFDQFMTFLVFMRNGALSGLSGAGGAISCGCGCGGRGRCCRR